MSEPLLLAIIGLISGSMLGLASRFGRFCTVGAVEDLVYGGRYYRALMWPIAIGTALIGIGVLLMLGLFEIEAAIYTQFTPNYSAHILGGLLFGYGMALSGMCGFTALARLGTGDMRALIVVLFIGIGSYVMSSGLLSPLRTLAFSYQRSEAPSSLAFSFSKLTGLSPSLILIGLGIILFALPFLRANFRKSRYPLWGMLVGLGVVLGWLGTFLVANSSFEPQPVESHTFSLPVGETILYAMLSSGTKLSFGIGSVLGVVVGALIGSLIKREYKWEACDDARELRRHILGALLMGAGAVIAFGCSVGQGISAMAVLYSGAPLTLLAIVVGSYIGLKFLVEG